MLGVHEEVEAAGFVRKNGASFRWGAGDEIWTIGFSQARLLDEVGANYAFQVERSKFDAILLDNARRLGVDVRAPCSVIDVIERDGRVIGVVYADESDQRHSLHSTFVIDASGHQSRTYRRVGERVFSQFFRNVAVYRYFHDGGRLPPPNRGNILAEAFAGGWMWYIPLSLEPPHLTSVGAVVGPERLPELQAQQDAAMAGFIAECPRISQLLAGARPVTEGIYAGLRTRKDWSYTNERFWRPGMVLVGDSACFIDPVLSTGVHLATYAGLLAARSVNTCLDGMATIPEREVFAEFEQRYRLEYETFYQFLVAFYDMRQSQEDYFWRARSVLATEERANEAFVRLLAGASTDAELYFRTKQGMGNALQGFAHQLAERPSLEARAELTRSAGERLHAFRERSLPFHAGSEELRRLSWGAAGDAAPTPIVPGGLVPSRDGLRWVTTPEP